MRRRAADILFDILSDCGVDTCFAVTGGGAMHLDNALALSNRITTYFNHHEQACAIAAEGYARTCGKPAIVCVTSGPGAANAINGVIGAYVDSIPMIVVSGQVRTDISVQASGLPLRYRGVQEFDIIASVKNMTKYAVSVRDPRDIRLEAQKAFDLAMHGRRGPVWLEVPLDVQSALVAEGDLSAYKSCLDVLIPSDEDVLGVFKELSTAKRPVVLAGSGIVSGGAREEFSQLAVRLGVPIVGQSQVADVLGNEHENFFGLSGTSGPRTGNYILQNADLIVALADSLSYRQTGFLQEAFAPNAKIIMVDADEYESKKPGLHIDRVIKCDIKEFVKTANRLSCVAACSEEWMRYCSKVRDAFDPFEGEKGHSEEGRVSQYRFWHAYDRIAPDDAVVALGNNTAICAKLQVGKRTDRQRVIANYACGSMGYDLPAAIGACIASGRDTVCATGDGSIMMNLQELQTIKQNSLPIKVVVFSNDGYGTIRMTSDNFFNSLYFGCSAESGVSFPPFEKVADAFGFPFIRCEKNSDVETKLEELLSIEGPAFMLVDELYLDPLVPKLMSRQDAEGHMISPKLEDLYPFVSEELAAEFMPAWE